jgi:RNA polymerase sigma-70 factor (ECF subfamily)
MADASPRPEAEREERFIEQARRGDLPAFNSLVLLYQTRVYNLCLRMLSDPDEAADATQDTFLSAYRSIRQFKGGQFRAWLLRIATNACLDALRARKRRPAVSLDRAAREDDAEGDEPLQVADTALFSDPEGTALSAELAATLQRGLESLPDDQRIALVLVDVQGLSYEEAATVTASNLGTVKSRINRARSKMRAFLRGEGVLSAYAAAGEQSESGERFTGE